MNFKRVEALWEKYPQVQIFSNQSEDLNAIIHHFLKQKKHVSEISEVKQRKIQRAITPFWQERFISIADSEALRVKQFLLKPHFFLQTSRYIEDTPFAPTDPERLEQALEIANFSKEVLERKLLSLSNGEFRRVLLARLWMETPDWIYFNDLFGGLDPVYRRHLTLSVLSLVKKKVKIAIRLQREDELLPEIPAFLYKDETFVPYEGALPEKSSIQEKPKLEKYEMQTIHPVKNTGKVLFDLNDVHVRFGETDIIKNLTWQVRKGEHWVVMGPNGAGKSTLLGLLSADHPQMYCNDITLLGKKPGNGLNIWEHKAKLGFFSPELSFQYREKLNLEDVLCSGYTTSLSLSQEPTWDERKKAKDWLEKFGFNDSKVMFNSMNPTDKRLILIARAAIKPPEVLILDEPTQGMTIENRTRLFNLLEFLSTSTTILLVSHYEEEWPSCMTNVLRMPCFSLSSAK